MEELRNYTCAVCGNKFDLLECNVCDYCDWEQDTVQEHDYRGGANPDSLNERKAWWKQQQKQKVS